MFETSFLNMNRDPDKRLVNELKLALIMSVVRTFWKGQQETWTFISAFLASTVYSMDAEEKHFFRRYARPKTKLLGVDRFELQCL